MSTEPILQENKDRFVLYFPELRETGG